MAKKLQDHLNDIGASLTRWSREHWPGVKENVRKGISNVAETAKGAGGETLARSAKTLEEAIPFLERAGYDVSLIEVGVGFSPKVSAHLKFREGITDEERMQILEDAGDRQMVLTILNALFSAANARDRLRFSNFHFTHIELELSVLPTVILKFLPNRPDQQLIEHDTVGLLD